MRSHPQHWGAFSMRVREIMTRNVKTVEPEDTIQDVARTMKELNVGLIAVCWRDHLRLDHTRS